MSTNPYGIILSQARFYITGFSSWEITRDTFPRVGFIYEALTFFLRQLYLRLSTRHEVNLLRAANE